MSEEFGPNFITLTDEDGNDIELEYVDALELDGQTYMAFFPVVEDDADEEAAEEYGLVILKSVMENGEELLSTLDSDEELDKVYDLFMEQILDFSSCRWRDAAGCAGKWLDFLPRRGAAVQRKRYTPLLRQDFSSCRWQSGDGVLSVRRADLTKAGRKIERWAAVLFILTLVIRDVGSVDGLQDAGSSKVSRR